MTDSKDDAAMAPQETAEKTGTGRKTGKSAAGTRKSAAKKDSGSAKAPEKMTESPAAAEPEKKAGRPAKTTGSQTAARSARTGEKAGTTGTTGKKKAAAAKESPAETKRTAPSRAAAAQKKDEGAEKPAAKSSASKNAAKAADKLDSKPGARKTSTKTESKSSGKTAAKSSGRSSAPRKETAAAQIPSADIPSDDTSARALAAGAASAGPVSAQDTPAAAAENADNRPEQAQETRPVSQQVSQQDSSQDTHTGPVTGQAAGRAQDMAEGQVREPAQEQAPEHAAEGAEEQSREQENRPQQGERSRGSRGSRGTRGSRGSRGRGGSKRAAATEEEGALEPGHEPETQALQGEQAASERETAPGRESRGETAPRAAEAAQPERAGYAGDEPEEPGDGQAAFLSEFPAGFGDSGPEDYFAALDGNDEDAESDEAEGDVLDSGESGERKRRSRSRRGRGRKKSSGADAAPGGDAAAEAAAEGAVSAEDDPDEPDVEDDDDTSPEPELSAKGQKSSRRKMFVSVLPEEQIEVVITEEGQVQEYYVEMLHQAKTKGNIYKGIVHNVDPNLQAAFVSYGAVKNGFLQIDEVHPEYYVAPHEAAKGRKYPPIQKVLRPGQEVLVQIVKEPAGTKGAFLTTYLSMPGRFLVLTPGREQIGVSRKVDNESERARLRELLEGLTPGPGLGVIVRTVSMGASKTNLQKDLQQLKRVWKEVRSKGTTEKAPCLVYQEMDLTSRAVRDYLTDAITEVWIDDEATANAVSEIAAMLFPRKQNLVKVHQDTAMTLFERFNVQKQLDQIHSREVVLPSGGRLVIDPTEALTAIDINSGRSGGKNNFEDMAYRTNMEAARMIPLQLRLRDIGGQVVADFIEMRDKSHWREVEKTLRNGMKVDRARYDVGKIGPFGLLEIVRQRLGSSAISVSTEPCPCCNGTGMRRNMEWQSQSAMREILRLLRAAQAQKENAVTFVTEQPLALHLLNNKRQRLLEMEQRYSVKLHIQIKQPDPQ